MSYFLCRLNTPRPTFAQDMADDERSLMIQHTVYWTQLLKQGRAELFGPVGGPSGVWGLVVVNVETIDVANQLTADDPVIRSGLQFSYAILPFLQAVVRCPAG